MLHDYWSYIPNLQLCVCYDKIGMRQEAIHYNDKSAEYKPFDSAVIHNRKYFETTS